MRRCSILESHNSSCWPLHTRLYQQYQLSAKRQYTKKCSSKLEQSAMYSTFLLGRHLCLIWLWAMAPSVLDLCLQKGPSDFCKISRDTQQPVQTQLKMSAAQWAAIAASEDRHDR